MKKMALCAAIMIILSLSVSCDKSEKNPEVTFHLPDGKNIVVELFPDVAPSTVASFLAIAETVAPENIPIDRFEPGIVGVSTNYLPFKIQGEMAARLPEEKAASALKHERGAIAAWHEEGNYDTNQGAFYFVLEDLPEYDGEYCVFGKVKKGLDILDSYAKAGNEVIISRMSYNTYGKEYKEITIAFDLNIGGAQP